MTQLSRTWYTLIHTAWAITPLACGSEGRSGQPGAADAGVSREADASKEPDAAVQPPVPPVDFGGSRFAARLAQPDVTRAVCNYFAQNNASRLGLTCEGLSALCQLALLDGAPSDPTPVPQETPVDDAILFEGCPATVGQFDACVSELIDGVVDDINCRGPSDAGGFELSRQDLANAPNCIVVFLQCPDLIGGLLPGFAGG